jgi:hypothetical protein
MSEPRHWAGEWYEHSDASSGRVYYANSRTGETSWEPPKGAGRYGDWIENTDPTSGRVYYSNAVTQQTTWDVPPEVA